MSPSPSPASGSPPKHAIIVAHPDAESFTLSVARAYCGAVEARGQTAILRDLYRMDFDPVLRSSERPSSRAFTPAPDVKAELDLLAGSGAFVLVYPIWFGTPPAMIKGYVERVLGAGFSHRMIHDHLNQPLHPLLGGRQLLSFSSSGSTRQWLADQGAWMSLQTVFDGYLARAFWMSSPHHVHFDSIVDGMDAEIVRANLFKVEEQAKAMCDRIGRVTPAPGEPSPA